MMNFINRAYIGTKLWLRDFVSKENGDVNIVSIVILIGIAVLLAIVFREKIEGLLGTLFGTIENSAKNAITN